MEFNEFIKGLREKCKLTQDEAAKEINVSVTTIQNWENKRAKPELNIVSRISKVYNTSTKEILNQIALELEPQDDNDTLEDEVLKYTELLPSELDFSLIRDLKFTKEEQDIFVILALNCEFQGNPVGDFLNVNNSPIEIAKTLKKFEILGLYSRKEKEPQKSYRSDNDRYSSEYIVELTCTGQFLYNWILRNSKDLFSIYKLSSKDFLDICSLYGIYKINEERMKYLKKISEEQIVLDIYEYNERYSRFDHYEIDVNYNPRGSFGDYKTSLLSSLREFLNKEYYEIIEEEFDDERYLDMKESYFKKKEFYDKHKDIIDDLNPPKDFKECFVRKVKPTEKALKLTKALDEIDK